MVTMLGFLRVSVVGGSISMLVLSIIATSYASWESAQPQPPIFKTNIVQAKPCAPETVLAVGGLGREDVPRLDGTLRLTYGSEATQYISDASSEQVINAYLPAMSATCWTIAAIDGNTVTWTKDGASVRIAAAQSQAGGRTVITYDTQDQALVAGYTYKLAQETTLPAPGTTVQPAPEPTDTQRTAPSASGETQLNPPPPSGEGSFQYPTYQPTQYQQPTEPQQMPPVQQPSACSEGQYQCNGSCVANGTQCGNFQYYRPGERSGQPNRPQPYAQPGETTQPGDRRYGGEGRGFGFGEGQERPDDAQVKAQYDEERLEGMKRGLNQFANGIKQMQRMVTRMKRTLTSCGVSVPPELQSALDEGPKIIAAIQEAQTVDELEQFMDTIPEIGATMQEWGPQLGDLTRVCEMMKHANREIKNVERKVTQLATAAKRAPQIQELVTQLGAIVAEMKTGLTEAKQLSASGDVEAASDRLEEAMFDNMEEFWSTVQEVETIRNLSQGLKQAKSELAKAEQKIKQLERGKKIDAATATELRDMVAQIRKGIADLQSVGKNDIAGIKDAADTLWDLFEEFKNRMEDLGQGEYEAPVTGGSERVNIELPDAFSFNF